MSTTVGSFGTPLASGGTNLVQESASDALTAVGTTQGTALALTSEVNRVSTAANATAPFNGVTLPASAAGLDIIVINNAANPIQVYGLSADTVNGQTNTTGITQPPNSVFFYACSAAGAWEAEGIGGGYSGSLPTLWTVGGITAVTGGQGSATALTAPVNRVTTCPSGAGVILPTNAVGLSITVTNDGANALTVFPDTGAAINSLGTNNGTLLPVGATATFYCEAANVWKTLVFPPREVVTAINTVGNGTLTAAGIVGGVIQRGGAQSGSAFSDATDTAAAIIAALHGAAIGQSWECTVENTTNAQQTVTNGASVTVSGITVIPPGSWARYVVTVATSSTVTMAGFASGPNVSNLLSVSPNIATGFRVTDGTNAYFTINTQTATDNTVDVTLANTAPSYASAAGSTHSLFKLGSYTLTLTGGTGVTALTGLSGLVASPTVTSASGTTVTTATGLTLNGPLPAGSVTFTNSFALDIPTFATNGTTAAGLRVAAPTGASTNLGIQVTSGGMTVAGGLTVTPATAAAITTTRVLTSADSGGTFSVAKTSAYAITLPTPAQGLRFRFMVLDTGANAVTISDGSAHLNGVVNVAGTNTIFTGTTVTLVATGGIGDWVEFLGIDATHYHVTGACVTAAKITVA